MGFKPTKPREYGSTKDVVTRLFDQVGGIKRVAFLLGVSHSRAAQLADPHDDAQITFDQVRRLMDAGQGCDVPARDLATLAGGCFTPMQGADNLLCVLAARSAAEHAEFIGRLLKADHSPELLTPHELRDIRREAEEALHALALVCCHLAQRDGASQ